MREVINYLLVGPLKDCNWLFADRIASMFLKLCLFLYILRIWIFLWMHHSVNYFVNIVFFFVTRERREKDEKWKQEIYLVDWDQRKIPLKKWIGDYCVVKEAEKNLSHVWSSHMLLNKYQVLKNLTKKKFTVEARLLYSTNVLFTRLNQTAILLLFI